MTSLTFRDVCKLLKRNDATLIKAVDHLLGMVLVLSAAVVGPAAAPALALIGAKNELVKTGKELFDRIAGTKDPSTLERQSRMEIAYCLVCYTAFFEAVDILIPELEEWGGSKLLEEITGAEGAITKLHEEKLQELREGGVLGPGFEQYQIHFPHPADTFYEQSHPLKQLYEEFSAAFIACLQTLNVWQISDERKCEKILQNVRRLPKLAMTCFKSQYFLLATQFEEFYVWSNLHEHEESRKQFREFSQYLERTVGLARLDSESIDLGFQGLREAIKAIPAQAEADRAERVIQSLCVSYESRAAEAIVEDEGLPQDNTPRLAYPSNEGIFVPQFFRAISFATREHTVEDEDTWRELPIQGNLSSFLWGYLSSPYSTEAPLIILGHPGSGKSLLTKIIAARFGASQYCPFRVALRNVSAECDIQTQIEEQIRNDTGYEINWVDLSSQFNHRKPLIILDGYDELLQARGKSLFNYLKKVQDFQKREKVQKRPVRAVVTSRLTLMNKAEIPIGATVIRLEPFNTRQRNAWIDIWNSCNESYFGQTNVAPFQLPEDKRLIPIAEQPLLLLMLAIYDSVGNQLRKSEGIDRTVLYDSLIRRFVERQKRKSSKFLDFTEDAREQAIEEEIERLGVAAVGMFNRGRFEIQGDQLNKDLEFFQLRASPSPEEKDVALSEADALLGSFFFIHGSKSSGRAGAEEKREVRYAFEFLHNTFGEFLTADFILKKLLGQTQVLHDLQEKPTLRAQLHLALESRDGFGADWFVPLIFTSLGSRPVVLEMICEWATHLLKKSGRNREEFLSHFDMIIVSHITRILHSNQMPSLMTEDKTTTLDALPLLGHMATYSMNLVVLGTLLSADAYSFDETLFPSPKEGVRAWDQLTYLWRSWFSLAELTDLSAVMQARRNGARIVVARKERLAISAHSQRLEAVLNAAVAIGDDITAGLAGLLAYDPFVKLGRLSLDEIEERLLAEQIDPSIEIWTERLRGWEHSSGALCPVFTDQVVSMKFGKFVHFLDVLSENDYLAVTHHRTVSDSWLEEGLKQDWSREFVSAVRRLGKSDKWILLYLALMGEPNVLKRLLELQPGKAAQYILLLAHTTHGHGPGTVKRFFLSSIPAHFSHVAPVTAAELLRLARQLRHKDWATQYAISLFAERDPFEFTRLETDLVTVMLTAAWETNRHNWFALYCNALVSRGQLEELVMFDPRVAANAMFRPQARSSALPVLRIGALRLLSLQTDLFLFLLNAMEQLVGSQYSNHIEHRLVTSSVETSKFQRGRLPSNWSWNLLALLRRGHEMPPKLEKHLRHFLGQDTQIPLLSLSDVAWFGETVGDPELTERARSLVTEYRL